MIDAAELQQMRGRALDAAPAVEAWRLRQGEGLYAGLPYEDPMGLLEAAAASAGDAPALADEVERLAPASYLRGPEACCEGDCEDEDPPEGQWCSHVTEQVATFDDVMRAETLAGIVESARRRLGELSGSAPNALADELAADIDAALEAMDAAESAGWVH